MKSFVPRGRGGQSNTVTLLLIAAGFVALSAAIVLGIADNLPGLVLVYVAVTTWILAIVHRWRRMRNFVILLVASLVGFPLAVVLHNLLYALGVLVVDVAPLRVVVGVLEVGFFLVGVLVCPPGAVIGALGSLVLAVQRWRGARGSGKAT